LERTLARGPNWGNPRIFCTSDVEFEELRRATPALYGFENAGPRPADHVSRRLKANQAEARQAIYSELDVDLLQRITPFREVQTQARDKASHLNAPRLGARLSADSAARLSPEDCDVQIVASDGLSAEAVHANLPDLLPVLLDGLHSRPLKLGQPIAVRYGRVKLAEHLAECLRARLIVLLVGERPGGDALAARSLSAYLVYHLLDPAAQSQAAQFSGHPQIRFEYTVVSNIYSGGLPPVEAGSVLAEKAWQILSLQAAGNRLESLAQTCYRQLQ
jgi:ethanolamine ammonia-lyase large subunit